MRAMLLRSLLGGLMVSTTWALALACSSGSGGDGSGGFGAGSSMGGSAGESDAGSAGGTGGATGGTGGILTGGVGGGLIDGSGAGGSSGFGPDGGCVAETTRGENIPVDMYVMLDISGSMTEPTGAGPSKWNAVRQALTSFLNDSRSDGLGVGIQFFPIASPNVPASCTSNADCGTFGFCQLQFCDTQVITPMGTAVIPCQTDQECQDQGLGNCSDVGQCGNDNTALCRPVGSMCGNIVFGEPCNARTTSTCSGPDCDVALYANPAVPIAPLPGNATPVVNAMNMQTPNGRTPTAASLEGAIQHAQSFAGMNPTHRVFVVYVTDGLPTECFPRDDAGLSGIAATGVSGMPSIETFVIGVFAPTAEGIQGRTTSNAIAQGGGTDTAFIVDPTQDVAMQFLDALDQIRGGALGCDFQVPDAPMGETLDYDKVNMRFSASGVMEETVPFVADPADCSRVTDGWHYDVDPATQAPTSIIACPQTCDKFTAATNAQVDIALGCETEIAIPR